MRKVHSVDMIEAGFKTIAGLFLVYVIQSVWLFQSAVDHYRKAEYDKAVPLLSAAHDRVKMVASRDILFTEYLALSLARSGQKDRAQKLLLEAISQEKAEPDMDPKAIDRLNKCLNELKPLS